MRRLHKIRCALRNGVNVLCGSNPAVSHAAVPVNLIHPLLHALQILFVFVPAVLLVEFFQQDAFGRLNTDGCQHIETGRLRAECRFVFIVHHFLQHLGIGLIALRNHVEFHRAGYKVLGLDACLLVTQILDGFADFCKCTLVFDAFLGCQVLFLHQLIYLQQRNVVRLTHQEGDGLVHGFIELVKLVVLADHFGNEQGALQIAFHIRAEGGALQPHHAHEVLFQTLRPRVMAAWAIDAVEIFGHPVFWSIAQELRVFDAGILDIFDFHFSRCFVGGGVGQCLFAGEQRVGNGKEGHVVFRGSLQVGILRLAGRAAHFLIGQFAEFGHHGQHLLFFNVAQQTVEIHMEGLQKEVGGHEAGEVVIVVALIDVEQLVFLSRHDGKSLTTQSLLQPWVERGELEGVHDIGYVHQLSGSAGEVVGFQFVLASFQFGHESLFLLGVADGGHAVTLGVLFSLFGVFLAVPETFL